MKKKIENAAQFWCSTGKHICSPVAGKTIASGSDFAIVAILHESGWKYRLKVGISILWRSAAASRQQSVYSLALISGELIFGHNEGRVSNLVDLKARSDR
ncbi:MULTISPECIES: hypothetical protein [unclassified Mesorhizobium]|uniref:hypothetical protein n=1 Tax=unclassified Mesorhizobium TaxID=325217 RepID=UPI00333B0E5E